MANVHVIDTPATELISLEEARMHLYLDADGSPPTHPQDPLIETFITAAREIAERHCDARFGAWQLELRQAMFGVTIELPDAPVIAVDSIGYIDTDGDAQTVDAEDYELAGTATAPVVRLVSGVSWPTDVASQNDAVRVRYTAGYQVGSPHTLPAALKAAMLLLVGHLYVNRSAVEIGTIATELPLGVFTLLQPYRRNLGV
jgi:uncharacterized phiE125 gp8 family phage protein